MFRISQDDLSGALERLSQEPALSIALLTDGSRRDLLSAARRLSYRPATPVIGKGDKQVHQQFDLSMDFQPGDAFHRFAEAFGALVASAAAQLSVPPLSRSFGFNDLILQRYAPGCRGITPHRDHLCYRDLVALVSLSGDGSFTICADRAGNEARPVPIPPGSVLLMIAPGYAGTSARPFHALNAITAERYSLGLRYDSRAEC